MPFDSNDIPRHAKILLRAAQLVERGHWKRKAFGAVKSTVLAREVTHVCAVGAIQLAAMEEAGLMDKKLATAQFELTVLWGKQPDRVITQELFAAAYLGELFELVGWNDAPDTTPAMVAGRLRALAAKVIDKEMVHAV